MTGRRCNLQQKEKIDKQKEMYLVVEANTLEARKHLLVAEAASDMRHACLLSEKYFEKSGMG